MMLEEGLRDRSKRSVASAYSETCYICKDPEFSLMGLPLCHACCVCGGHVPADDTWCDDCRHDQDSDPTDVSVKAVTAWANDGGAPFETGWWM